MSVLRGRTEYGDSIEDEWVVAYLLRELTKKFEDLWVKVCDSDGEFLLIEASGTLPAWLEPEVADNRVSPKLSNYINYLLTVTRITGVDPSRWTYHHQATT